MPCVLTVSEVVLILAFLDVFAPVLIPRGFLQTAAWAEQKCKFIRNTVHLLPVLAGIQNSLQMESFILSHRYILQTSALPKLNEDIQLLSFLWFSKTAYFISHAFEL